MIILIICITGILVYVMGIALFCAAKMGQVSVSISFGKKAEGTGIEYIYTIPEGADEPVVTDDFLEECRMVKEKYEKDNTVLTSGVAASEYEMPAGSAAEFRIMDFQKQIVFEAAAELLYHHENMSNEDIAHRLLDAISDKKEGQTAYEDQSIFPESTGA